MKIYNTNVMIEGEPGFRSYDTIDYEGEPCIVTKWISSKTAGYRRPERLIRVFGLPHEFFSEQSLVRYSIQLILPTSLFDPDAPLPKEFQDAVVDQPLLDMPELG